MELKDLKLELKRSDDGSRKKVSIELGGVCVAHWLEHYTSTPTEPAFKKCKAEMEKWLAEEEKPPKSLTAAEVRDIHELSERRRSHEDSFLVAAKAYHQRELEIAAFKPATPDKWTGKDTDGDEMVIEFEDGLFYYYWPGTDDGANTRYETTSDTLDVFLDNCRYLTDEAKEWAKGKVK